MRSNRFHYASRFARELPVFFFQHNYSKSTTPLVATPSGIPNLTICDVCLDRLQHQPEDIFEFLTKSKYKNPLIWIYDHIYYQKAYALFPSAFIVYHATENYLVDSAGWSGSMESVANSLLQSLSTHDFDFIVACAPSIKASIIENSFYAQDKIYVAPNGCDLGLIRTLLASTSNQTPLLQGRKKIVVFQGTINKRVDFELISRVSSLLPEYEFRFYGPALDAPKDWEDLLQHSNIHHYGCIQPDDLYRELSRADVGIVPYIQDRWIRDSLPLKSFEYLACGTPVVSVPIDYLSKYPDLFTIASTADEFAKAIVSQAARRYDSSFLASAQLATEQHNYEFLFGNVTSRICSIRSSVSDRQCAPKNINILILYCPSSTRIACIKEHLGSFFEFSRFNCEYLPATPDYWNSFHAEFINDYSALLHYDVIVIHYSVRISVPGHHIHEPLLGKLFSSKARRVAFIQDEYEFTECSRRFLDSFQPDILFTNIPLPDIEKVYPQYRYPNTKFVRTLTGYVGDPVKYSSYVRPYTDRSLFFAYRGRQLPPYYGSLGFDKFNIGRDVAAFCQLNDIPHDISNCSSDRISGTDWYHFLASAKATLGTESGSNLFDETGSFKRLFDSALQRNSSLSFQDFYTKNFAIYDNFISMGQLSPKFFEAICLRTVLVLYEGTYSGILQPNIHYLPLKRDLSNMSSIIDILNDEYLVQTLTSRVYSDIVGSTHYSYQSFIADFDSHIDSLLTGYRPLRLRLPASRDFIVAPPPTRSGFSVPRYSPPSILFHQSCIYNLARIFYQAQDIVGLASMKTQSRVARPLQRYRSRTSFIIANSLKKMSVSAKLFIRFLILRHFVSFYMLNRGSLHSKYVILPAFVRRMVSRLVSSIY